MSNIWTAVVICVFTWWAATGLILVVVRKGDRTGSHRAMVLWSLPLLIAGAVGLIVTGQTLSLASVYLAFFSALTVWGWFEFAFLTGVISGPNKANSAQDSSGWDRFISAWRTVMYAELSLLAVLCFALLLLGGAENIFGLWTFIILFAARISAKLNVYLGVPNINTEFLPSPMAHLSSHFRHAAMNWMFPLSITGLSFAVACFAERILANSDNAAGLIGFVLLTTLTALALLEHWMMVLPLSDAKLWRWMLPAKTPANGPSTKS